MTTMAKQTKFRVKPSAVEKEDGRWYVTCPCGTERDLTVWAIAHLGETEMSSVCTHCSTVITLLAA